MVAGFKLGKKVVSVRKVSRGCLVIGGGRERAWGWQPWRRWSGEDYLAVPPAADAVVASAAAACSPQLRHFILGCHTCLPASHTHTHAAHQFSPFYVYFHP